MNTFSGQISLLYIIPYIIFYYFRPKMKELLQNGTTLVVDRYAYSGVAYSAAKQVCTDAVRQTVMTSITKCSNCSSVRKGEIP